MKAIVLAGGTGSRLFPATNATSKQLLPVFDKPMIYYPLSVLMLADIRDILIITRPDNQRQFKELLGDGRSFGLNLTYEIQDQPKGIAESVLLSENFIGGEPCALILGDNLFYGQGLPDACLTAIQRKDGATVFVHAVKEPSQYGVITFDKHTSLPISIEEKPLESKSNWAVTGLYFYDSSVVEKARRLKPSARGELEITDINKAYLEEGCLNVVRLGRGHAWLDTGTPEQLYEASSFVRAIQNRQGVQIACLEEIAFEKGWIDGSALLDRVAQLGATDYADYVKTCTNRKQL